MGWTDSKAWPRCAPLPAGGYTSRGRARWPCAHPPRANCRRACDRVRRGRGRKLRKGAIGVCLPLELRDLSCGACRRAMLGRIGDRRLAHPGPRRMRIAARCNALGVAWAVAFQDLIELAPVDRTEIARSLF